MERLEIFSPFLLSRVVEIFTWESSQIQSSLGPVTILGLDVVTEGGLSDDD
jgi:hypothetical protein